MNGDALFDPRLTNTAGIANSGHSFATMLLGFPTEIRRGQGNTLTQGRINAPQFFFQDDYRLTSRLTINLGLRYEFTTSPTGSATSGCAGILRPASTAARCCGPPRIRKLTRTPGSGTSPPGKIALAAP
jgi:outer membrane receptor protein involved in Fe transport